MIRFPLIGGDLDLVRRSSTELVRGTVVDILGQPVNGLSLILTIEQLDSGLFWNGAAFGSPAPFALLMFQPGPFPQNDGVYQYQWNVPTKGYAVGTIFEYHIEDAGYILHKGRYRLEEAGEPPEPTPGVPLADQRFPRRRQIPEKNPNSPRFSGQ